MADPEDTTAGRAGLGGHISAYDKVFNDAVAARWTTAEDKGGLRPRAHPARGSGRAGAVPPRDQFYKENSSR